MNLSAVVARAATWGSFVKIEHTLFSLPLLFAGAVLGAGGLPPGPRLLWVAVAGAGARTLALALNRIIDRRIDARNPRTAGRELPSGRLSILEAWLIALLGLVVYLVACMRLPLICLQLSPLPVLVFVLYPYMKRFTSLAHFGVGLALALAPLGAWVAVTGSLAGIEPVLWLALFAGLWVAGFDIIYATLDEEFDRQKRIFSLPARMGRQRSLRVSAMVHALAIVALLVLYVRHLDGWLAAAILLAVVLALVLEQRMAHRVNLAFFHLNIVVGFLVFALVIAGIAASH